MAHLEKIVRYVSGVRVYCPTCKKQVTPLTIFHNGSKDGATTSVEFACDDCNTSLRDLKL